MLSGGARGPVDLGIARTGAERRPHEVRWTSVLRGPKRSGDRIPDVSLGKIVEVPKIRHSRFIYV